MTLAYFLLLFSVFAAIQTSAFKTTCSICKHRQLGKSLLGNLKLHDHPQDKTGILTENQRHQWIVPYSCIIPWVLLFQPDIAFGNDASSTVITEPGHILTYWRYFLSGAISASLSHVVTVPFDVVKTRIQTRGEPKGKGNMITSIKKILDEEGVGALLEGKR
jgi:hypothetical protein